MQTCFIRYAISHMIFNSNTYDDGTENDENHRDWQREKLKIVANGRAKIRFKYSIC